MVSRRILLEQPVVDLLILIHGFPAVMRVRGDRAPADTCNTSRNCCRGPAKRRLASSEPWILTEESSSAWATEIGRFANASNAAPSFASNFGRHTAADRDGRCEFIRMAEDRIPSADAAHGEALDINAALVHLRMRCDEFIEHLQDQRLVVLADPAPSRADGHCGART